MPPPDPQDFEALASSLGVADFDLMLVCDGSGTKVNTPCGWACMSYFRPSSQTRAHFGGATGGTNNYAELMPFVHTLWAFHSAWAASFPDRLPSFRVLCVSDSEVTVRCGSGQYARNANLALWAAIDQLVSVGFQLVWRHVPRNSNPLNKRCDETSGRIRLVIDGLQR